MRKLLTPVAIVASTLFIVSCGNDEGPINSAEKQQELFNATLTAISEKVSTDESASGLSNSEITAAFEGWTTAFPGASPIDDQIAQTRITVESPIAVSATWTSDNVYQLDGRIVVLDGATLTIEPGTRIEGNSATTGEDAAVLMIARGGKIMARGTAENPIIMTTTDDDGTLTKDDKGRWGGLVVLGKAPVSAKVSEPQIEGVSSQDTNGLYGGDDAMDNSGVIEYVSIRHGGAIIDAASGDEINGLTLGGVGSGTTIKYVEVYANSDDGIEFFGGNVNVDYALVYAAADDAIDIDQSYAGTVSNYAVYVDNNSDEGLEIDGREGALDKAFTLTKGTIDAIDDASITCDFKAKSKGTVSNLNANGGIIILRASFDAETLTELEDASLNVQNDELTFETVNASFSVETEDLLLLN